MATNSSGSQPSPMPRSIRPPEKWSIVATRRASTTGCWNNGISTAVCNRTRSVRAATYVNVSNASYAG